MNKKTIKTLIKVTIWGAIIITACPQLVDEILNAGGTIISQGLKWCGGKMLEGMQEKVSSGIPEFPGKGWIMDKFWNPPDSSNPFKDWLTEIIESGKVNGRQADEEDVRIITDIITKGGTTIER